MYKVICKYCGKEYESKANRPGVCPDCKTRALVEKNNRYRDKAYDRITIYLPKGMKDSIKAYLNEKGLNLSMNELVNKGLDSVMEQLVKEYGEPLENKKDELE